MWLLTLISLFLSISSEASDSYEIRLSATTFNTQLVCVGPWCSLASSPKPQTRSIEIGKFLKEQDSDFVFLQELTQEKFLKTILRESSYSHYVYDYPTRTAILSKHPLESPTSFVSNWQGSYIEDCKRSVVRYFIGQTQAIARLPNNNRIFLAHTHTLPRYSELPGFRSHSDSISPERVFHVFENLKHLEDNAKNLPIIFGGDFNMNQSSEAYKAFFESSHLIDSYRSHTAEDAKWKSQCTFCDSNKFVQEQNIPGEGILDYIWASPSLRVLESSILRESGNFSDHHAVKTLFLFRSQPNAYQPSSLSSDTLSRIRKHFKSVSIHPFCWLAPVWGQRENSLKFLDQFFD